MAASLADAAPLRVTVTPPAAPSHAGFEMGEARRPDGADEVQEAPVREVAPADPQAEEPEERALLHAVEHHGEPGRHPVL